MRYKSPTMRYKSPTMRYKSPTMRYKSPTMKKPHIFWQLCVPIRHSVFCMYILQHWRNIYDLELWHRPFCYGMGDTVLHGAALQINLKERLTGIIKSNCIIASSINEIAVSVTFNFGALFLLNYMLTMCCRKLDLKSITSTLLWAYCKWILNMGTALSAEAVKSQTRLVLIRVFLSSYFVVLY